MHCIMIKIYKFLLSQLTIFIFVLNGYTQNVGPWNLDSLYQVPKWEITDVAANPGMKSIFYKSIVYNGKPVDVFAYYSAPPGEIPEGGWPALVHIHGGGGTAYPQWVQAWNAHGYACISMDLEGHCPGTDSGGNRLTPPNPGPKRVGIFSDWTLPVDEQWYYQAVAEIVKAHSLIRSFPEINPDKIGVCGPSWGGTLTSTVMGVDSRFCFAIPVYGSGYIAGSDGNQGKALPIGSNQTDYVNANYDGSAYFNNVTCPTLWVNGTNDIHFSMPCTQQSASAVHGPAIMRYTLKMPHGNFEILNYNEIYAFADQVTRGGPSLPVIKKPQQSNNIVYVNFSSETAISSAQILYTLDNGSWVDRVWNSASVNISDTTIFAVLPDSATTIYFTAIDARGLMVSSEYLIIKKIDPTNLAIKGTATQSSTDFSGEANHAIDGNISGAFTSGSVTQTTDEDSAWWQVDLGASFSIGDISIFNRTDACCSGRLSDFTVYVFDNDNNITYSKTFTSYPDPSITTNAGGVQGKVIKIRLNRSGSLSLAEVQVFEQIQIILYNQKFIVKDSKDQILSNANVSINSNYQTTNSFGEANFSLLKGSYNVTVSKSGCSTKTQTYNFDSDSVIYINLQKSIANVEFRMKDGENIVRYATIKLNSVVQQANSLGIATYYEQSVNKDYTYTVEKSGYKSVSSTFTLSNDTIINIQLNTITGLNNIEENLYRIYPNPVSDILIINQSYSNVAQYNIINTTGQTKLSGIVINGNNSIDLCGLSSGVYIVKLADYQQVVTRCIIKK